MDKQKKYNENEEQQQVEENNANPINDNTTAQEEELATSSDKTANEEPSLEEKLTVANDKYLRLVAEFDNFRKRTARERLNMVLSASEDVISGLLPVLDDFERALEAMNSTDGNDSVKEGIKLIYEKMFSYLQGRGLQHIETKNKSLDTDFHEAIGKMPVKEKSQKGKIVNVVQNGYTLNGKVIRYAKVIVGE